MAEIAPKPLSHNSCCCLNSPLHEEEDATAATRVHEATGEAHAGRYDLRHERNALEKAETRTQAVVAEVNSCSS